MNTFSFSFDTHYPFLCLWKPVYPFISTRVIDLEPFVPLILLWSGDAQILVSAIKSVAITVIYLNIRVSDSHKKAMQ
jgi:hypothetical protein